MDHLRSLAGMLGDVVAEYWIIMARPIPDKAREIVARHAAGKAAVGHIAALSKLLRWSLAAPGVVAPAEGEAMGELLKAAHEAMTAYDDGEDNDA